MVKSRLIPVTDLADTIAPAGVDPELQGRALQDAIRSAIADRRGFCSWNADHADWGSCITRTKRRSTAPRLRRL